MRTVESEKDARVRRVATKHILGMLTAAHGPKVADYWAWERTPMPCGLPSDEQLGEGLRMALSPPLPVLDISTRIARAGGGYALLCIRRAQAMADAAKPPVQP
jgi:hypothetical protein